MKQVRKGITRNADGSLTVSNCRAQPGHEGMYGCHHFRHCESDKEAQKYITMMTVHKNEYMGTVDFDRDVEDLNDSFRQYMISRGYKEDDLPVGSENPMLVSWFHNDASKAERFLNDAQNEGVLPKMRVSEELGDAIRDCVKTGVKVEVVADRVVGLKTDEDTMRETDVWMTANKITMRGLKGDAPITLMVDSGKDEGNAASEFRRNSTPAGQVHLTGEQREDFEKNVGYACLQGRHAK